ncbi:MAG: DUF2892 domain-containing protein [Rhodocyclaceae bacterium]
MKINVGGLDRILRVVGGLLLIVYALMGHPWAWLGIIPLATGVVGFCPVYLPLGLNTCSAKTKE